jgi:4-hydroxy-4-methyl-2-oxoglutarate aldolase
MKKIKGILIEDRVDGLTPEIAGLLEKVDPATIGHYTEFGFLHPRIRPMVNGKKIVGNAVTVRIPPQDSEAVYLALDTAKPGDVLVIDRSHDRVHACVGEIVALTAAVRKVSAIVVDGPITDIDQIKIIGMPVFATGGSNLTTKFVGTGGEVNMDISCGGVVIHPGDIIIADVNGVLALRGFEIEALAKIALKDQEDEIILRKDIQAGKSIRELFYSDHF